MSVFASTRGGMPQLAETNDGEETYRIRLAALVQNVSQGTQRARSWLWEDWIMKQQRLIGVIMLVALAAFELFNFDTTRFALENLFGETSFVSLPWATVLALAFCGIDFAGLARLFVQGGDERASQSMRQPETVYLWGAWFLAAGMNAVMTWWAVSLTLLEHDFGNEVLSHAQILRYVPIFIATLVWLTRILLIGAFSVASSSFLRGWRVGSQPATAADRRPALPASNGRHVTIPGSLARALGGFDEMDAVAARSAPPPARAPVPAPARPAAQPAMRSTRVNDLDEDFEDDLTQALPPAPKQAAVPARPPAPPVSRPAPRPAPKPGQAPGYGASTQPRPVAPRPVPAYHGNGNGNGNGSTAGHGPGYTTPPPPMPPDDDFPG